jgi:hypothetical protein
MPGPLLIMPPNNRSEGPPNEAVVRERSDGQFDVICKKCSQRIAVATTLRGVSFSVGRVIEHRCGVGK